MALILPNSIRLERMDGGYFSNSDFNSLKDNQTNDARCIEYTRQNTIRRSNGYVRLLNTALTKTGLKSSTGLTGQPVKGHFNLVKQNGETEVSVNIVAAGGNLWKYTSATASIIMSNLSNDNNAYWTFIQTQDPRPEASGTDDIVIGVNGFDYPIIWNGTEASATFLSAVTGSSGVQIAHYIASVIGRVYLGSIEDSTDIDSRSKLIISDFTSEGNPAPHIYPAELFDYAGGSDQYGKITGMAVINSNLMVFKRNTMYKYMYGGSTVDAESLSVLHDFSKLQVDQNIGCVAPKSIATVGNAVVFLGELGVYLYDGSTIQYIGLPIEPDLKNINNTRKAYASGVFYRRKNQYWLSIASQGSIYNDTIFIYDFSRGVWMPPRTNVKADILSTTRVNEEDRIVAGDHLGYLYLMDEGTADGQYKGLNRVATTINANLKTLNFPSSTFTVAGDGLYGLGVKVAEGQGIDDKKIHTIVDSTGSQLTVDTEFPSTVSTGTIFIVLPVPAYYKTNDFDFQTSDVLKMFKQINVKAKPLGKYNTVVNYIIDFNEISNAGTATIYYYNSSITNWDNDKWDVAKWGPAKNVTDNKELRFMTNQDLVGEHFALRFYNDRANEPFEINGFEIVTKKIGRQ